MAPSSVSIIIMLPILLFPLVAWAAVPPRFDEPTDHTFSRPTHQTGLRYNLTTIETVIATPTTATTETVTVTTTSTLTASSTARDTIAPYTSPVKPKILFIANEFEFGYLTGY